MYILNQKDIDRFFKYVKKPKDPNECWIWVGTIHSRKRGRIRCRRLGMKEGRSPALLNKNKTHCIRGHPLTGGNLYITSGGGRVCRECKKLHKKGFLMSFIPIGDKALIKPDEPTTITKSGLEVVSSVRPGFYTGTVVAIGPGRRNKIGDYMPMEVKPGQKVLYNQYAGSRFSIDAEEHLLIREEELLAVIDKDTKIG